MNRGTASKGKDCTLVATRCATTDTGMPSSPMTSIDAPSIAKPIGTPNKSSATKTHSSKVNIAFSRRSRIDHGLGGVLKDPLWPFVDQDHAAVKKCQSETYRHGQKIHPIENPSMGVWLFQTPTVCL